jgi:hypothetical protein
MELQGRNLSTGLQGDDVKLLQTELQKLGYELPETERQRATFGEKTRDIVQAFQKSNNLATTGVVDAATAKLINAKLQQPASPTLVVRGRVLYVDGKPVRDLPVRAFDQDLRSEELLGETKTAGDGGYEIAYAATKFLRAEKKSADLVVKVHDQRGTLLAASPTRFNAADVETVNLVVGGTAVLGPSEYEVLVAELTPLIQGLSFADLTEDAKYKDVTFLAGETGFDPGWIAFLGAAHRLSRDTKVAPEAFYGFFRKNLPANLLQLLALDPEMQRAALRAAVAENIIPASFAQSIDDTLKQLQTLITQQALQPSKIPGQAGVGTLISPVLPAPEQQIEFLTRYTAHSGPIEAFWADLRNNAAFKDKVDALQLNLQLGAVALNHLPMVQALRQKQVTSLRQLATLEIEEWQSLIAQPGPGNKPVGFPADTPGANDKEKAANYARAMSRVVENAFPTAVITSHVKTGKIPVRGGDAGRKDLLSFLSDNPDFELTRGLLDSYVAKKPDALKNVQDRQGLRSQVSSLQRAYKMARSTAGSAVLLQNGLDSAFAVTRMGQQQFMKRHETALGGTAQAKRVYENAAYIRGAAMNLLADQRTASREPVQMLPRYSIESDGGVPDMETLFGSLDLCDCEYCRSVYSPAAYLTDILHFLKDRPSKIAGKSAKDVLFARRPDLGEIELTCENTNTPLPYVDLANEVLENAVSPGTALPDNQRQTRGLAQELAANPQYLNVGAYNVLRQQVHPVSLPFDLWSEEVRAYLAHLGAPRAQVMQGFQRAGNPSDLAIAVEQLGMTQNGRKIVTGAALVPPRTAPEFWGFPVSFATYVDTLKKVRGFLDRSGLTYAELDELMKMRFVNPTGTLTIKSDDPADPNSCDTTKLVIDKLDAAALDRMHRFVRLWRALGWTMRALDRAITALGATKLTDDLLQELAAVQSLHKDLDTAVTTVLSWFAPLGTAEYTDVHGAGGASAETKSLYAQLFQNPTIIKLAPGEPDLFKLNAAGTELAVIGSLTDEPVVTALLATLQIGDSDLARLVAGDDAVVTAGQQQNLENLSRLFRHASLARALKLKIPDLLRLKAISGKQPFVDGGAAVTPAETRKMLDFVKLVEKVRNSPVQIPELDYLLRHQFTTPSAFVATDEAIAQLLDEIRRGLQKIVDENTFTPQTSDTSGDLTRKKLALIAMDPEPVEQVVSLIKDTTVFETPLAALPAGVELPQDLPVVYDDVAKVLSYTGVMTPGRRASLLALSAAAPFQVAVNTLYGAPRDFLLRHLKSFGAHTFAAPLAALPAGLAFPPDLAGKAYYDSEAHTLFFIGVMNNADRGRLLSLSGDAAYQAAVNGLFAAPAAFVPGAADSFIAAADAVVLFDADPPTSAEFRFNVLLQKLMSYLRVTLSESFVKQKLGQAFKLETQTIDRLLTQWVGSPTHPARKSLAEFLDPAFSGSSLNVKLTSSAFPDVFAAYRLLAKIAMVVAKARLSPTQVQWLFDNGPAVGWLNLNTLPLTPATTAAALFPAWERLLDLFALRDQTPLGEQVLGGIFALSRQPGVTQPALLKQVSDGFGWNLDDLNYLVGAGGFALSFPAAYQDEQSLARLKIVFRLLKRLGVSAEQAFGWCKLESTADDSRSVRQAVKAKYGDEQWLTLAKPLRDVLRHQQRAALVAYLVPRPDAAKKQNWKDADGIYEHYLIDVQMCPCMITSRIKQAIGSVQLFVQRCLMNLEPDVAANAEIDVTWRDWQWMKNFRVWEANRKIFLYPENWIEPELRDDKSPFFRELESEIAQNDITSDTAESAFRNYLEKLADVAHMQPAGLYHQVELDSVGNRAVDILHVFARTPGTPHLYSYRRRVDSAYWTPWEKVSADIEGEHLIPVVWNRRLYVFWPVFTEQADKAPVNMPSPGGSVNEPHQYWTVQLAWSEYRNKKWSGKKLSSKSVVEYWRRPTDSFAFKLLQTDPDLRIGVFIRLSEEVDLRDVSQQYFHWNWTEFQSAECGMSFREADSIFDVNAITTPGSYLENMAFAQDISQGSTLVLHSGKFSDTNSIEKLLAERKAIPTLGTTPTSYNLMVAHQDVQFAAQRPFFYQDAGRAFFVIPQDVVVWTPDKSDYFDPGLLDKYKEIAWAEVNPVPDPIGPVINPEDPFVFEQSFPVSPGMPTERLLAGIGTREVLVGGAPVKALTAPLSARLGSTLGISKFAFAASAIGRQAVLPETERMMARAVSASVTATADSRVGARMLGGRTAAAAKSQIKYLQPGSANVFEMLEVEPGYTITKYRIDKRFAFQPFYHPFACLFMRELNRDGVDGLLQRRLQLNPESFLSPPTAFSFNNVYHPKPVVTKPYPKEDVDFAYDGAYASYNWELFFHVPLLIATRLMQNQRFEEAQRWFQYIFDPTDTSSHSSPQRYWRTRRFFETTDAEYQKQQIQTLLGHLAAGTSDPELSAQVQAWRKNPFKPHVVARLRTTAYQKTVVMKYLDNLIGWGDMLFGRDTIETINEATQLYVLAAEILGRVPERIPPRDNPKVQTYNQLEPKLDDFSNALVRVETLVPSGGDDVIVQDEAPLTLPTMLYFCIPKNDKLLGYWDTVADRLFKIRNCMNIEGVVRQLPLFEPPIDPAMLVRAAAAGIDISSALSDIAAALPPYRFVIMVQKASELCADLRVLGSELLAALEKRDAETLALLRSSHEIKLLNAVRLVREQQVEEARQNLDSVKKALDLAQIRSAYYSTQAFINASEQGYLDKLDASATLQGTAADVSLVANILHIIPNIKLGSPTTIGATLGGDNLGNAVKAFTGHLSALAGIRGVEASSLAALGGFERRRDEWGLQQRLAKKEIEQLEKQVAAADLRLAIAARDLQNHDLQVENAQQIDDLMHDKFTNQDLYDWMVGQIASLYFQSYKLAYDVAKKAERTYRFELGLSDSSFIQFGYWDSLKKGLLAGERLYHDLKRMEVAHLEQNKREYELTRPVSLAMLDPLALLRLKEDGRAFFELPEALFDRDYPGHYLRRIRSVSLTIPSVTGPYTSINCTLTLVRNSVRKSTSVAGGYERTSSEDGRFADAVGAIQSIATSSGQNDAGLFELNFRDERYLPFEGAGAISLWNIELPRATNAFDPDTVNDVILHLRYTAREGGGGLKEAAMAAVVDATPSPGARLFSTRHDFGTEHYRFLHPAAAADSQQMTLALTPERFAFPVRSKAVTIKKVELFLKLKDGIAYPGGGNPLTLRLFGPGAAVGKLGVLESVSSFLNGILHVEIDVSDIGQGFGEWRLTAQSAEVATLDAALKDSVVIDGTTHHHLKADVVEDLLVVCHFEAS